ncbi:hypothetical protein M3Y94_01098600 [Aphelenchoides besseyi]|nr:hypothetical protein M3Y94_01098600 [Aphelenchoides besseyi]
MLQIHVPQKTIIVTVPIIRVRVIVIDRNVHDNRETSSSGLKKIKISSKKTTLNLRNWKAAQRQSQYLRMRTGRLQKFKLFFKRSPEHKKELEVYAKTKKSWKFVPANEQLDLPPIQ